MGAFSLIVVINLLNRLKWQFCILCNYNILAQSSVKNPLTAKMNGDVSENSVVNGVADDKNVLPKVSIELSGGAQFLFGNKTQFDLLDEIQEGTTVAQLIQWLTDNRLEERAELFVKGDSVRPGLLVLINDADWELMGEKNYVLKSGDNVHFLSTLHGG